VPDILDDIVRARREDYGRLGPGFGFEIPSHRPRGVVPFLAGPGAILEIKRASPSKGDIAPDLDPVTLAGQYAAAGARNVSVLTETRYFKGSLADLVAASTRYPGTAFLRKDFILFEDEIEVAYRCGADAVLLIARILERPVLLKLAALCRSFGMVPFIEVRDAADVAKLQAAAKAGPVLAGVNARDLATFRIDPLVPATLRSSLPCRTVFESGASSPGACRFARQLGFDGILIGEAAARDPERASGLVEGFASARADWVGQFWREIGKRAAARREGTPLVKICGITNAEDALLSASLGADLLGFVFAKSPRAANAFAVREIATRLAEAEKRASSSPDAPRRPLLVGVIVDPASPEARDAFDLARAGVLDAIQYHGDDPERDLPLIDEAGGEYGIGRYSAVRLGAEADLERIRGLMREGEPRALVDARVDGVSGGTGKTIPRALAQKASELGILWLAGGINPGNVRQCVDELGPELVDASSGLEALPGKKDHVLLKSFFREIRR
jgi:indole-3-glycerol phosphate synthase/phosphoribosylanthranilate isomerase